MSGGLRQLIGEGKKYMGTRQLQHQRSLWRGGLIAPWIVPLGVPILYLFTEFFSEGAGSPTLSNASQLIFAFVLFGVPFTYFVTFVFLVPMALWLRAKNSLSSILLCAWCAILGPATMFTYGSFLNSRGLSFVEVLTGVGYGLITGIAFCTLSGVRLLARRTRMP
jgi:hypothetical protein